MHRCCTGGHRCPSFLPSFSFITPSYLISQQLPPLSLPFCHRCPLSNLITQALYPPLPVCRSLLPSCLYPWPWLAAGARHQGQISPSFLPFLPLPFLFSPLTLHFRLPVAALKFLSARRAHPPSFPPLVLVKRVLEMTIIVFCFIVLSSCKFQLGGCAKNATSQAPNIHLIRSVLRSDQHNFLLFLFLNIVL